MKRLEHYNLKGQIMATQNTQKNAPQQQREQSSPMQCAGDILCDPTETVKEYPVSSALVVFGIGIGAGVLLAKSLFAPEQRPRGYMAQAEATAERYGKQIMDAVRNQLKSLS
ncbi:MAG: hypothetical protein WKF77_16945 [Planctomycetaceae bacterium]